MCGWQVKLCDPIVTHGPHLSASEIKGLYMMRYINSSVEFLLYFTSCNYCCDSRYVTLLLYSAPAASLQERQSSLGTNNNNNR